MKLEVLAVIINKNIIEIKKNKETNVTVKVITHFLSNLNSKVSLGIFLKGIPFGIAFLIWVYFLENNVMQTWKKGVLENVRL